MNNIKCFPFSRNQYFFGKLLTTADFETEQQYFNNKRRVQNRLFFGAGVVYGLTVTHMNGSSIIIDAGFALDDLGREIVVEQAVVKKLSAIDGFMEEQDLLYLCIEYAESDSEPVHNIVQQDGTRYNKKLEGCRFYLTYDETPLLPDPDERFEDIFENKSTKRLYLAKISLVRYEDVYEIENVISLPFEQRIVNLHQLMNLQSLTYNKIEQIKNLPQQPLQSNMPVDTNIQLSTGTVTITPPWNVKAGDVFYSEEISHGLGCCEAYVVLGIQNEEYTIFGSGGIFPVSEGVECAARVNRHTGMFQIGVHFKSGIPTVIKISWAAYKDNTQKMTYSSKPVMRIDPNITYIPPRDSLKFTAYINDVAEDRVVWSVKEADGGIIDNTGRYIAPDKIGVFEIMARSINMPNVMVSTFVVVIDK